MSTLIPAMFGLDQPVQKSPRMPTALLVTLVIATTAFYLSNSASYDINIVLLNGKWVPQIVLTVVAAYMMASRPRPAVPVVMMLLVVLLLIVGALGVWTSVDAPFSLLSLVTVFGTIFGGYFISALIVATDSRRAYFELLATLGRVVIVVTILFALAGLNLGRGGGLSAWSDNPNTLALIMAPSLVVFAAGCIERRPGWPVWHAAFFVVGFFLLWATNSRASAIWIGLSLGAFWIYRRGPNLTILLTMVGLIVLIGWWVPIKEFVIDTLGLRWSVNNIGASPLSGREEVWRIGWHLFWERPITGYGLGTSQDLIRDESWKFVRHQGLHFHSSYIMAAVEMGVFGLLTLGAILLTSLTRAMAYAGQARLLPRESWPLAALPFALIIGSLGHAVFESWLLASGNANMLMFWTWVWMTQHQAQVKIRKVVVHEAPAAPLMPAGAPLPAR